MHTKTKIGGLTLQPGRYLVQHRVVGSDHRIHFTLLKEGQSAWASARARGIDLPGEVSCRLEPIAAGRRRQLCSSKGAILVASPELKSVASPELKSRVRMSPTCSSLSAAFSKRAPGIISTTQQVCTSDKGALRGTGDNAQFETGGTNPSANGAFASWGLADPRQSSFPSFFA